MKYFAGVSANIWWYEDANLWWCTEKVQENGACGKRKGCLPRYLEMVKRHRQKTCSMWGADLTESSSDWKKCRIFSFINIVSQLSVSKRYFQKLFPYQCKSAGSHLSGPKWSGTFTPMVKSLPICLSNNTLFFLTQYWLCLTYR